MNRCDNTACEADHSHRKVVQYTHHTSSFGMLLPGDLDAVGGHGTHVAGTVAGAAKSSFAGNYNGTAKGAKIAFDDISPDGWSLMGLPYDLNDLFPPSYNAGARIHTNSWGSYGNFYSFASAEVDQYTYEHDDLLVIFAAGNSGPFLSTVGEPATSKNSLSVGSSSNTRESYVEHGYGLHYNLSLRFQNSDVDVLIDILPADFGAEISPDTQDQFADKIAVLDMSMLSFEETKFFCKPPDISLGCAAKYASSPPTWASLGGMIAAGDPANALETNVSWDFLEANASWHRLVNRSRDDSFEKLPDFGFDFCVFGQNVRDSAFVGSNSYITFGAGEERYRSFSSMPVASLRMGVGDRSYQRVYGKHIEEAGQAGYVVRFEGTAATWGVPGSPNMIWEATFWSNQTIVTSVFMLHACASGVLSHENSCIFGLYDEYAIPVLTYQYHSSSSVVMTGFAKPTQDPGGDHTFRSSASGFLMVLNFEYLRSIGEACQHEVLALNADRYNFTGVIFGGGEMGFGSPATKIFGQSEIAKLIKIPVMSISNLDTGSILFGSDVEYSSGSPSIFMLRDANSSLPIVSSERSDRMFTHKDLSYFSSRGPTMDFRFKPDIVAPGQDIFSANSDGKPGTFQCDASAGMLNSSILSMSGTSMAAPGVAGAAALVRQYYVEGFHVTGMRNDAAGFQPSSALVKATILHSGSPIRFQSTKMTSSPPPYGMGIPWDHDTFPTSWLELEWSQEASSPSYEQGYGLMDLSAALSFADSGFRSYPYDRQLLNHSSYREYCFENVSSPLRVSLVWTDPPGYPFAAKALVNNLDLSIKINSAEDEAYHFGNAPHSGDRYLDTINNVEQITLDTMPAHAHIKVRVTGTDIPEGPQAFALMVTVPTYVHETSCFGSEPANCENGCSSRGTCVGGICSCHYGFTGTDCSLMECGNGKISSGEQCDDGNFVSGDGCSSSCEVEAGFRCEQPDVRYPSTCSQCECGCLVFTDYASEITSTGSWRTSCEIEIDRGAESETQILVHSLTPGSSMDIVYYRPCGWGMWCDPYGYDYDQCMASDMVQMCEEWIYYTPESGFSVWGQIERYRGMHGIRVPSSRVILRIYTPEDYTVSYGPALYDVCGDGIIDGQETCDDRNMEDGDGCSSRCWQECDFDHCCTLDLADHGAMRIDDRLLEMLPGRELSSDSSCLELRFPEQHNMLTMLDVSVSGNHYSETCPFSGRQGPLTLIGPGIRWQWRWT